MTEFKPTWLMIKQHRITGLKYFCKTTKKDPFSYKGSGVRWGNHLRVHGRDVETTWCQLFEDKDSLMEFARTFSVNNDIVNSDDWANLVPEDGITGWPPGQKHRPESIEKCRLNANGFKKGHIPHNLGRPNSNSHYAKQIAGMKRFRKENPELYMRTLDNLKKTPEREKKRLLSVKKRMSGSNNWNYDPIIYTFKNRITNEVVNMTRNEFIKTYDLRPQNVYKVINGFRKTVNGWLLIP